MRHAIKLILMVGVTAGAVMAVSENRGHAQGADPNAAPNPYKMQENWAQLTDGRKFGQAIKVQVDHSDGKSIWVFDRCASNDCSNSMIPPIQKFDASGKLVRAFGANMFNQPHGFYVDHEGNVWVADERAQNGKGNVVVKFSPQGQVLMTLGKPGMPGNGPGFLDRPSGVVVAPNGDIYVADGHGGTSNDRIVKFAKDGKFITAWGKHGKAAGEFDTPHGIALDSAGREFVAEWKQFGRPSDIAIDKNDVIYVADSQSNPTNNPGFKQGVRIGSAKDGKVTAFIPEPSAEAGTPEGVGVDDAGNVYGGYTAKMTVRRFVKG
jgi:sugar lactone lactonase YvrE